MSLDVRAPPANASFVNTSLLSVAIVFPIFATTSVILRLMTKRWKTNKTSNADDWFVIMSLIMCWGHAILTMVAGAMGGVNTITVNPQDYVNIALRTLWMSTFFLVTALYTVKISILLFYYHIFHINEKFRKACIVMIVILTCWWISSLTCAFLVSDPFDSSFRDAKNAKHRYDFNAWYLSNSGLSILFDIVILCFPIPVIRTLKVDRKRKFSIIGIFWLGGFVCVSAIVRFVLFYNSTYTKKLDSNYGRNTFSAITYAFIWAEIEPNCSVIAACLPTYGPYFKADGVVPRFISNVKSSLGMSTNASSTAASAKQSAATPSFVSQSFAGAPQSSAGYVELEKMTSSQKGSTGEIVVERNVTVSVSSKRGDDDLERGERYTNNTH